MNIKIKICANCAVYAKTNMNFTKNKKFLLVYAFYI